MPVMRRMSPYARHALKWSRCELCELCSRRDNVVLARGTIPCDLLFIGEAPGASEDAIGRPFIGPAGKLLDQIIDTAVATCCLRIAMTNLVACIPKNEDNTKLKEPTSESINACRSRVEELIDIARPSALVAVGTLATTHLDSQKIGLPVYPVIHPAAILRMSPVQKGMAIQRCIIAVEKANLEVVPF